MSSCFRTMTPPWEFSSRRLGAGAPGPAPAAQPPPELPSSCPGSPRRAALSLIVRPALSKAALAPGTRAPVAALLVSALGVELPGCAPIAARAAMRPPDQRRGALLPRVPGAAPPPCAAAAAAPAEPPRRGALRRVRARARPGAHPRARRAPLLRLAACRFSAFRAAAAASCATAAGAAASSSTTRSCWTSWSAGRAIGRARREAAAAAGARRRPRALRPVPGVRPADEPQELRRQERHHRRHLQGTRHLVRPGRAPAAPRLSASGGTARRAAAAGRGRGAVAPEAEIRQEAARRASAVVAAFVRRNPAGTAGGPPCRSCSSSCGRSPAERPRGRPPVKRRWGRVRDGRGVVTCRHDIDVPRTSACRRSICPCCRPRVYDHGRHRFRTVNAKAIEFWHATDRAELLSRDLSDLSQAVRARLDGYLRVLAEGDGAGGLDAPTRAGRPRP